MSPSATSATTTGSSTTTGASASTTGAATASSTSTTATSAPEIPEDSKIPAELLAQLVPRKSKLCSCPGGCGLFASQKWCLSKDCAWKEEKCLPCDPFGVKKKANAAHYQENRTAILAQQKEHYQENSTAILAQQKEHYQENRTAILAQQKEHYQENRTAILAQQKEYRKANRERLLAYDRARNRTEHRRNWFIQWYKTAVGRLNRQKWRKKCADWEKKQKKQTSWNLPLTLAALAVLRGAEEEHAKHVKTEEVLRKDVQDALESFKDWENFPVLEIPSVRPDSPTILVVGLAGVDKKTGPGVDAFHTNISKTGEVDSGEDVLSNHLLSQALLLLKEHCNAAVMDLHGDFSASLRDNKNTYIGHKLADALCPPKKGCPGFKAAAKDNILRMAKRVGADLIVTMARDYLPDGCSAAANSPFELFECDDGPSIMYINHVCTWYRSPHLAPDSPKPRPMEVIIEDAVDHILAALSALSDS